MTLATQTFSLTEHTLGARLATLDPGNSYTVTGANNYAVADWFVIEDSALRLADGVRLRVTDSGPELVKDGVGLISLGESGPLEVSLRTGTGTTGTVTVGLVDVDEAALAPDADVVGYKNGVTCADLSSTGSLLGTTVSGWVVEDYWADHFTVSSGSLALKPDRHFAATTDSDYSLTVETITVDPSTGSASRSWENFSSTSVTVTGLDADGAAVCRIDIELAPDVSEPGLSVSPSTDRPIDLTYGERLGGVSVAGVGQARVELVTMTTDQYLTLGDDGALSLAPGYRLDAEGARIEHFDGRYFGLPTDGPDNAAQVLIYHPGDETPSGLLYLTDADLHGLIYDQSGELDLEELIRPGIDDNPILDTLVSDSWFLPTKMVDGKYDVTFELAPAGQAVTADGKTFDGGSSAGSTVAWGDVEAAMLADAIQTIESVADVRIRAHTGTDDTTWKTGWSNDFGSQTDYAGEVDLGGNPAHKYTNLGFVGIEPAEQVDATGMVSLNLSVWRTDPDATLKIKLVDFGPDGVWSSDGNPEHELTLSPGQVPDGRWVDLTVPLAAMDGLTSTANIAQIIITSLDPDGSFSGETLYLDDLYFSAEPGSAVPDGYELVFADEFNQIGAGPDPDVWVFDLGTGNDGWGNWEAQSYQGGLDDAVIVGPDATTGLDDGALRITAKGESGVVTSARVRSDIDDLVGPYGYYEIRAKLPSEPGAWPAVWLLGNVTDERPWPDTGEIDLVEWSSKYYDEGTGTTMSSALHFRGSAGQPQSYGDTQFKWEGELDAPVDEWHTYQLWWSPDEIRVGVDGGPEDAHLVYAKPSDASNDSWPYDHPMDVIMNLAIGGTLGGDVPGSDFSYDMYVDYVRIYQGTDPVDGQQTGSSPSAGPSTPTDAGTSVIPLYSDTYIGAEPDKVLQLVGTIDGDVAGYSGYPYSDTFVVERDGLTTDILIHELLHTLGLAHPFESDSGTTTLPGVVNERDPGTYQLNTGYYTVMSYGSDRPDALEIHSSVDAPLIGTFDVAAIQAIYGANDDHNAGDTTYTLPQTLVTLWDGGGSDTLNFSTNTSDCVMDLRAASVTFEANAGGYVSHAHPDESAGGYVIARDTVIENARGGRGDDRIHGNEAPNAIAGNAGDDEIYLVADGVWGIGYYAWNDDLPLSYHSLDGLNRFEDIVSGDGGEDRVILTDQDDALFLDDLLSAWSANYQDVTGLTLDQDGRLGSVEFIDTGLGDDLVDLTSSRLNAGLTLNVNGGGGHDTIWGGLGNDSLSGGGGSDTLAGGKGDDTLAGGDDADVFEFAGDHGHDTITDFNPGQGDKIRLYGSAQDDQGQGFVYDHLNGLLTWGQTTIDLGDHGPDLGSVVEYVWV